MTYASEMFAWYAGSIDADTYFCPERHGMYFGGFGMKTAPAMGKQDYSISTSLTGDSGQAFLATLDDKQRKLITDIPDLQRKDLNEIVKTRRAIATELRHFQTGDSADKDKVLREALRVLKPGGRFAVSDVVVRGEVPAEVRRSMELWVGCIAGALEETDYVKKLAKAGFDGIDIEPTRIYSIEDARQFLAGEGLDVDAIAPLVEGKFMSAFVRATKPAATS